MKISLFIAIVLLSSCSTLKRSMISGALIGGVVGGTGGAIFSPDSGSRDKNAYLFGIVGSAIGAGVAYLLNGESSKPTQKAPMILDSPVQTHKEVPLFDFSPELKDIRPEVNFKPLKKYEVPLEQLPPELQGKVKKQFIIEYESEGRTLEIDNRTIEISPFKAWEHVYEK